MAQNYGAQTVMASSPKPKMSVCIPAYEMGGKGAEYLNVALQSLASQTLSSLEVIVSDQSSDAAVLDVCTAWQDRLPLCYIKNHESPRGSAHNTNHAMRSARGEIVKILFMDDFLIATDALQQIADAFENTAVGWCLCGSELRIFGEAVRRRIVPRLSPMLPLGHNTVGHPSVLAVRRQAMPMFNPAFDWLMDVDYYTQCHLLLGTPAIIAKPLVAIRLHPDQQSRKLSPAMRNAEARRALSARGLRSSLRGQIFVAWRYLRDQLKASLRR